MTEKLSFKGEALNLQHSFYRTCAFLIMLPLTIKNAFSQQVDFDDLEDEAEELQETVFGVIDIIILIILGLGLAVTIGQYVTNGAEQGKKWLIGWVVALAVYIVGFKVLGIG